jgi:hypothetical protein
MDGALLLGDPRKICRKLLAETSLQDWNTSATQRRFSCIASDCSRLWRSALKISPLHCALSLRIISDTLQWARQSNTVVLRTCQACQVPISLEHFVGCSDSKRQRAGASVAICNTLRHFTPALATIASRWMYEADLLGTLKAFGIVSAIDNEAQIAGVVGLFSSDTARSALRRRGATSAHCDLALPLIRLLLLSWISRALSHTA